MSRGRGPAALATAALGLLLALSAAAEVAWHESYARGLQLEARSEWGQALQQFQHAARLAPVPQKRIQIAPGAQIEEYDPRYHIALCLVELGRPRAAAEHLKAAWAAQVTPPAKLKALRARIQSEIRERTAAKDAEPAPAAASPPATGALSVETDPPGATVLLDGTAVGTTPLRAVQVAPGPHHVRAQAAGYLPAEERVTVEAGAASTLVLPLAVTPEPTRAPRARATRPPAAATPQPAVAAASAPPAPATPTPPPAEPPGAGHAAAARGGTPELLLGLLGVAALAAGAGAWAWRRRRRPRAPSEPARSGAAGVEEGATVATGTSLGPYELRGVLGRGGMATTYRARKGADGRAVALKVPHEGCLSDPTFVARFLREGKLGEQLHHPGIVRIYGAGEESGRPFIAMELISGHTLKQEMREHAPFPLRRALEIARDVAEALDYAHAKGVVHRDLKPENVMLLPDGAIKVMDFGIARLADQPGLTTSNLFLGTPLYAAPESVDPRSVDHRADLYALGIMLFEMLEGSVPFVADSPFRVLEMHLRQPLPAREALAHPVPGPVWAVVARLCEKDPAARYRDAAALLVELNRLLNDFSDLEVDHVQ